MACVAVIGFNSRGQDHLKGMQKLKGVRVVALCDVDSAVLGREVKKFQDANRPVTGYQDIRRLLEDKDIDAITIATPNHWHSLAAIWGIQAGKDVYVEKPVSHNLWEGRQLVTAARKHGRIVQTGTQCRSSPGLAEAVAWVQAGNLGKIKLAGGLRYLSGGIASAKRPGRNRCPRRWIMIYGSGRRQWNRCGARSCIMTGIGSGRRATAISATRAFTRWILRAGFWARRNFRRAC